MRHTPSTGPAAEQPRDATSASSTQAGPEPAQPSVHQVLEAKLAQSSTNDVAGAEDPARRALARIVSAMARRSPLRWGLAASILILLGSFGGGAIRQRGGVLETLGLESLKFGHGAAISNTVLWFGTLLYVWAWVLLGVHLRYRASHSTGSTPRTTRWDGAEAASKRNVQEDPESLRYVRRLLLVWIAPLVLAAPIMSRDVYSYLMQGTLLRDGFDAYTQGPAVNPNAVLVEVSRDWRNTTTPYGPLHLWIGEGITSITGDNVTAGVFCFKLLCLIGFGMIVWAVPHLARHFGADPAFALWVGVANPVMVFHLIGGMHNEAIMVGLVSIGLVWALRGRFYPSVAIIGVAMALKATAAFTLPFVVWIGLAHFRRARQQAVSNHQKPASRHQRVESRAENAGAEGAATEAGSAEAAGAEAQGSGASEATSSPSKVRIFAQFCWLAASGAALTVAVLAVITYASRASWGWIAALTGNSKVINPLAFPSLVAGLISQVGGLFVEPFPYNAVLDVTRTISMALMAAGFVAAWWVFRRNELQAMRGIVVAYCVAFFFNAVTLPWYYASILPLVGVIHAPRRIQQFVVFFSVVIALAFTGSGNHQLYSPLWMTIWGLTAFIATACIWRAPVQRTSPNATAHDVA